MSLNKAIEHGKEHRKPYYGSKRFDHTCRNHGSCSYCRGSRTRKLEQWDKISEQEIKEAINHFPSKDEFWDCEPHKVLFDTLAYGRHHD